MKHGVEVHPFVDIARGQAHLTLSLDAWEGEEGEWGYRVRGYMLWFCTRRE